MNVSPSVWRLIAENRIEDAIRSGQFSNLSGLGQPLNLETQDTSPNWWLRAKAKRESLNLLPPALELARQVERRVAAIGQLEDETEVRQQLQILNQTIVQANLRITWGPPSQCLPVDVESFVARWHKRGHQNREPGDTG